MNIQYCSEENRGAAILQEGEPLVTVISYGRKKDIVRLIDEDVERRILLSKATGNMDIDQYFHMAIV